MTQTAAMLAASASLALLSGWLWWLAARADRPAARSTVEGEDLLEALEAPAEQMTPAEDGRLRLQELRGTDRLALDELLSWSGREDLSRWYRDPAPSGPDTQTDPTGRPASPADSSGSGGQRDA